MPSRSSRSTGVSLGSAIRPRSRTSGTSSRTATGRCPSRPRTSSTGVEPRLKAIQRSAEVRGIGLDVQGFDPFRLSLTAADYDALRDALQGIVVAFETAA